MKQLIAISPFVYAGVELAAGDTFDATESDAFILINIGKARDPMIRHITTIGLVEAVPDQRKRPARYATRELRAKT